jgi:hypothetical protein
MATEQDKRKTKNSKIFPNSFLEKSFSGIETEILRGFAAQ